MQEIVADILKAKEILETNVYDITRFERVYAFSNENLTECFENFDIKNKKCLTVLGSSDQVFDLYLKGAEAVDAFDINFLSRHYFYLKKAALEADFTKDEYFAFFNGDDVNRIDGALDVKLFSKLKSYLEKDERLFWSYLFETYTTKEISTHLFSREILKSKMLERTISYLSDEGFLELKKIIHKVKINFYNQDLFNLPEVLNDSYDFMYLSNIVQYIDGMISSYNGDEQKNQTLKLLKYKSLLERLRTKLKKDGKIVAGYIYAIDQTIEKIAIFNPEVRQKLFPEEKFNYYYFGSIEDICDSVDFGKNYHTKQDACFVYPSKK